MKETKYHIRILLYIIHIIYLLIRFLYELAEQLPDSARVVDAGGPGRGGGAGHLHRDSDSGMDHPQAPLLTAP